MNILWRITFLSTIFYVSTKMEPSKLNQVSMICIDIRTKPRYLKRIDLKIVDSSRIYVDSRYFSIDIELPYVPRHISTYVTVWLYHSSQVYSELRLIYWNPASHLVISIPVMISDDGIDCNDILMVAGVTEPG